MYNNNNNNNVLYGRTCALGGSAGRGSGEGTGVKKNLAPGSSWSGTRQGKGSEASVGLVVGGRMSRFCRNRR